MVRTSNWGTQPHVGKVKDWSAENGDMHDAYDFVRPEKLQPVGNLSRRRTMRIDPPQQGDFF
jgi:hypothetical protein